MRPQIDHHGSKFYLWSHIQWVNMLASEIKSRNSPMTLNEIRDFFGRDLYTDEQSVIILHGMEQGILKLTDDYSVCLLPVDENSQKTFTPVSTPTELKLYEFHGSVVYDIHENPWMYSKTIEKWGSCGDGAIPEALSTSGLLFKNGHVKVLRVDSPAYM